MKWQPANTSESSAFETLFCDRCKVYDCLIPLNTMLNDVDDPDYPEAWRVGEDGKPTCTAFEVKE